MDHRLIEGLMEAIAPVIRESLKAGIDNAVIDDVRPLINEAVENLPKAKDGTSVTIDDVRPLINEAVAAIPVPKDGASVTIDDVRPLLEEMVAAIPVPKDGASVTIDDVRPLINEAFEALPKAKDGVGLAEAIIDRDGVLILTLTDGSTKKAGVVVGRDVDRDEVNRFLTEAVKKIPRPKDGLGFEDLTVEHDGERTLTLRFVRDDLVKEFPVDLPIVIDRGVWREGKWKKGDGVTWGGSFFIAQRDTEGKPETKDCGWRLAVKRGQDGKSAYDVARKAGFSGTESDWVASLKGPAGLKGDKGDRGDRGYGG